MRTLFNNARRRKIRVLAGMALALGVGTGAVAGSTDFIPASYGAGPLAMAIRPDSRPEADYIVRECTVASVHDGDSMRARCPGFKKTVRIRLEQIDAPEIEQAYGTKSRDYLRSLCPIGKSVTVHDVGRDVYQRHLGRIFCGGKDVNAEMVTSGSAWVYDHYADDAALYRLQKEARLQRRGLWRAGAPVPPWKFRQQNRR